MNPIYLAIGIHNHQPVGNFDFVLEDAYQKSYLPFFEILEKNPHIRLAMHYSGILLKWIEDHHPEYVERLRILVKSGQIEMMTGGYYEPILSVIPEPDRQGQIRKLSDYIQKQTGDKPEGLWCAERIWEPQLAGPLYRAGIGYTVLDDTHFKCAGLRDEDLYGYFLTEELGQPLRLFPISARLRYTIPFQDPQVTVDYLRQVAETGENRLLVFADDGEKFGVWPGTHEHVFGNGWLNRFFGLLKDNDWIRIIHFRDALNQLPPHGRVYLPTASYMEMMQWTLPAKGFREYEDFENRLKSDGLWDRYGIYVRGGIWRSFLAKYPESNQMHKKMIRVSRKLSTAALSREDHETAQDHLWAGQCNCPYWHGVFGGLYLPHLRHANFSELIQAEQLIDSRQHDGAQWIRSELTDLDADGHDEAIMENDRLNLYFSPLGGRLTELDDRIRAHNYLNLLSRKEEGYHRKLTEKPAGHSHDGVASIHDIVQSKEEGLERYLIVDSYQRGGWIDHFLGEAATLDGFYKSAYPEAGDFLSAPYSMSLKQVRKEAVLTLSREGLVKTGGQSVPVVVEKTIRISAGSAAVHVRYRIRNLSADAHRFWFGIENGFAFHAGSDPVRYYSFDGQKPGNALLNSIAEQQNVKAFMLTDDAMGISAGLKWTAPASVWRFPLETVSMSESGFERVYQGSVVLVHWKIEIPPKGSWSMELVEQIENRA
ncbi:DUF1926 domain-containing protein [bacterium]|nr:DUF1926 domain-containing protein [bacterium]